jgi:hypothetical protein
VATLFLCYFSIKSYNRLVTCNNKKKLRGEGGREGGGTKGKGRENLVRSRSIEFTPFNFLFLSIVLKVNF